MADNLQISYSRKAHRYDEIEQDRNYLVEVRELKERIKENKKSRGKRLLDVGCGTGPHLFYLKNDFLCTGIDLNKQMLDVAKKKLKRKVNLIQANMIDFKLDEPFDIIVCLFSVINHVKNYSELKKSFVNLFNHLKKGGVCIIEPYYPYSMVVHDKRKYPSGLLRHDVSRWSIIMKNVGFNVKHLYIGLNQKAKGIYILTK